MKKIYLLAVGAMFVCGIHAQSRSTSLNENPFVPLQATSIDVRTMAVGDTLCYIPCPIFFVNPTDAAAFDYMNVDQDGLTPQQAGAQSDWMLYYSLLALNITHFDSTAAWADTGWYMAATSWFNPVGQADNWLTFGPITVPAIGAKLSWRVRTNPDYRDGYRVLVNGTGLDPAIDFGTEVIYSRPDAYPNPTDAVDTVWTFYSANIPPSYNGSQVYFGFNHNANDMDRLRVDEILMVEYPTLGVDPDENQHLVFHKLMPNPAKDFAVINYAIVTTSEVSFEITDIHGRVISMVDQGTQEVGEYNYQLNVSGFAAGIYYVTLHAGSYSTTQKLIVAE